MSVSSSKARQLGLRLAITMLCAGGSAICTSRALGATATATATSEATAEATGLDEIIVTGSRQAGMKASDSPAPIQILSAEALKAASGNPDLMSTLAQVVPSLTMQAFGFDMAGQTLLAKLRGLSPNHVLVLVNGKRRHTTANLAVDAGSPFQGGAGVDLNFIPLDAIDHIEVLTDGAAAQYGTDAIAGVINIILKKNSSGGSLSGTYGNYMNGGGNTNDVSGTAGLEPTEGAYFTLTGEVHGHGHSNQGHIDPRVNDPANQTSYPGSNLPAIAGYPYLNQISGDGEQHTKLAMFNTGFDFEGGTELYGFGSYGDKHAASFENYRMPTKQCYSATYAALPAAAQALTSCGAQSDANYPTPFGFQPQESTNETDFSLTAGVKGTVVGWNWDVGSTYGGDTVHVYTIHTANTGYFNSTGIVTPSDYYDGTLKTTQWTTNADINRDFDIGLAGPLNVAFGGEYRRETYSIAAGIPLSYTNGGASSFPGWTPTDAGNNSRKNYAGYVDFAAKPIEGLRVDVAGRFEHYSDFGNAHVGKLTARYDFAPEFALRGTVSNGFRAPTLAEEFYSSTNVGPTTAFVQLPPNSAGGKLLGLGDGLQPEKSVNLSLGLVWRPTPGMNATLDVYQIQVTNRIVGTGNIYGTVNGVPTAASAAVNAAIAANGNSLDPDVLAHGSTGINVFANGIDTRTRGADLTFDFPVEYAFGKVNWTIGATYNKTTLTKVPVAPASLAGQSFYDATALSDLTTANPKYVVNLGALWTYNKVTVNFVEKIYGPSAEYENDDGDNGAAGTDVNCSYGPCNGSPSYYQSKIGVTAITNLDLSYMFKEHLKLTIGATNLFNRFPNKLNGTQQAHEDNPTYGDNAGVTQYPGFSPFGINGGFYYAKATYSF